MRAQARGPKTGARGERLLLVVLVALALTPFADKAFHIDDPVYLAVARQIREQPTDFFGFSMIWYYSAEPVHEFNQNPPLLSYFLALASSLVGWSERGLHFALLLPTMGCVLGVHALARRASARPLLAALATFAMPVFFVSATTIMTDISMLAFYCGALLFWTRGIDEARPSELAFAGLLAGLAALTKYFGASVLALMLVYGLAHHRRLGAWIAWLLIPTVMLGAYEAWAHHLYGHGLIANAVGYAPETLASSGARPLLALVFAGGCVSALLFFLPGLWRVWRPWERRALVGLWVAAGALIVTAGQLGQWSLSGAEGLRLDWFAHALVFAAAGSALCILAAADLLRRRDAFAWLLACWVGGTLIFSAALNWTTSARSVLPLAPAAGILLARALGRRSNGPSLQASEATSLALALGLCLLVAQADLALANASRSAAREIAARYDAKGPLHYFGHWGFQHYMDASGAQQVDILTSQLGRSQLVVYPENNSGKLPIDPLRLETLEIHAEPVAAWLRVMTARPGAGFYSSLWGPFPFLLGRPQPARFQIHRLRTPIAPATPPPSPPPPPREGE